MYFFQKEIWKQIFKKPGPAISIDLNSLKLINKCFFKISANLRGEVLLSLAKVMATLQDKSAFWFWGGSSTIKLTFVGIFISFFFSTSFKVLSIFFWYSKNKFILSFYIN